MNKIVRQSQIWDLHVHTPYKYNKSANSYNCDDKDVFISSIKDIIVSSKKQLGMISFTDHNYFDKEIYIKFKEVAEELSIQLIPGIEVDLKISSTATKTKHILFYFRETEDYDKIDSKINTYIIENRASTFDDFISFLFENGFKFAISPHAFKQKAKGIEYEWVDDDNDKNANRIKLFSSHFFVFWESDKSSIVKAKEYIEEFYDESDQAIANFSDSHNYEAFKKYLDNPSQYFRALNNFNGIMMAGTEPGRISDKIEKLDASLNSQRIKTIIIDDNEIELSDKLNVIIGGRGKGKSILIDKIGYYFNCNSEIEDSINKLRKKFLKTFEISIKNFLDSDMNKDLTIKFLNQSYIDKLFSDESGKQISQYFSDEFNSIDIDNHSTIVASMKASLLEIQKSKTTTGNVDNIIDSLKNNIKTKIDSIDEDVDLDKLNIYYEDEYRTPIDFYSYIIDCFPEEIIDSNFQEKVSDLVFFSIKKIFDYNLNEFKTKGLQKLSYLSVKKANESLDEELKAKNDIKDSIRKKLQVLYCKEMYIIKIINELYAINKNKTKLKIEYQSFDGTEGNKFYFIKYRNIEHPVEFARRILTNAINGKTITKKGTLSNEELFRLFMSGDDIYNTDYSQETVIDIIKNLTGIKADTKNKIIHFVEKENKYLDLFIASPGMQTNSLMEYVLNQNSNIPLLIDQPEDNVDNESRYKLLTKWIKNMKNSRQIILVSHDANIVINGDAENLIIADCVDSKFTYDYGALEYDDNIERAAIILDGGKNAIRRRIQKYGE